MIYVDIELQAYDAPRPDGSAAQDQFVSRVANWFGSLRGPFTRRRVGNLVSARALAPLCASVCYFASDLGGIRGVAALIAALIDETPPSDLPNSCLPNALVIVDTASEDFDSPVAEKCLLEAVTESLHSNGQRSLDDVRRQLKNHFKDTHVAGICSYRPVQTRARQVRRRLISTRNEWLTARKEGGFLFQRQHFQHLSGKLLDHFCKYPHSPFSFVAASRPVGFTSADVDYHLREISALMPSEVWLWHLACPLVASAIIFASHPPGAHPLS
ncbi:hypothetical protein LTR53_001392 [Teratosphaeriaceae sp. CCFEE 6253]|nr:hypothetical protein LTR53_001392 [Teratosphaeriaceae sp. CCFEE 6253]